MPTHLARPTPERPALAIATSLGPLCAALGAPPDERAIASVIGWYAPPEWVRACVPPAP